MLDDSNYAVANRYLSSEVSPSIFYFVNYGFLEEVRTWGFKLGSSFWRKILIGYVSEPDSSISEDRFFAYNFNSNSFYSLLIWLEFFSGINPNSSYYLLI